MSADSTHRAPLGEHPLSACIRLRAKRRVLWMRKLWSSEAAKLHPAAIQHEDVDRILSDPVESQQTEARFYVQEPRVVQISQELAQEEERLASDERWTCLVDRLQLSKAEWQMLALALAAAWEPQLGKVLAYLHDQPEMVHPTPWLASALFGTGSGQVLINDGSALRCWDLLKRVQEMHSMPEALCGWQVEPAIAAWLKKGGLADLPARTELSYPEDVAEFSCLYVDVLDSMLSFANEMEKAKAGGVEIELASPKGGGRRTLAAQFAASRGQSLLVFPEELVNAGLAESEGKALTLAGLRSARLRNAVLYWEESQDAEPNLLKNLLGKGGLYVVGRPSATAREPRADSVFRSFELKPMTLESRLSLWESLGPGDPPEQIKQWLLSPKEIVSIKRVADAGPEAITQTCRRPTASADLLVRLPLPFEKDDLILTPAVQGLLDDFEDQVRHRWAVYEEWGFQRLCPNGRGIIALFAGPSGTGKTMAAQVLAKSLGLELYRLDQANVINKYIGETEKRLKIIFDECDRANFLLLIDECEGMFGQRFASKDAHDRYANLEIDYLLQRLERFQGVAILGTNRKSDLDPAFLRRIRMIVDFLLPGPEERLELWQSALLLNHKSSKAYLDGVDLNRLAEKLSMTGAEIKLAALNAAFLARAKRQRIGMKHVLAAVSRELEKKGQKLRGIT